MNAPRPVDASTFARSPLWRLFTRDCSTLINYGITILTFSTLNSTPISPSFTHDSVQTRSRHGSEPIHFAYWRTTVKSIRYVAMSTSWKLERVSWKVKRLELVSEVFGNNQQVVWECKWIFSLTDLKKLYPVVEPNLSDSGSADCCLEFLAMAGQRSLPEVNWQTQATYSMVLMRFIRPNLGCHDDGSRSLAQR